MKRYLFLAALAFAPAIAGAPPMSLKFKKGEILKFKITLTGRESSEFKGETMAIRFSGSHVMSMKVTSATASSASMSVSYSGAQASATAESLPPSAKSKKDEIEKEVAKGLQQSMGAGNRTQTVNSRGVTTYKLAIGDGKTITIEGGAYMMLVLPSKAPSMNVPWTATVRMPVVNSSESLKLTYKVVGSLQKGSENAYKILLNSSDTTSKTDGNVSGKLTTTVSGYVLLGQTSGQVLYGEVIRETKTVLTHKQQGTRTGIQSSKQVFTKI